MLHPDCQVAFINDKVGRGIVAAKLIPKGTIVWIGDPLDQHITPAEFDRLPEALHDHVCEYAYCDEHGDYVLCWDESRFINHSCDPTIVCCGFDFELAVRDILPGEQITGDYAALRIDEPMECHCGSPHCRGTIWPQDAATRWQVWDEVAKDPILCMLDVEQPLWPLVQQKKLIERICAREAQIPSCRDFYLDFEPAVALPLGQGPAR